jgi:predicted RNA-binding Zn-ribbon protein involved in translation (DUF1610 family)
MRSLVQPSPSMHCELCYGELRFKLSEPDDPIFDMGVEIFVCTKCGHERSLRVLHDPLCRTHREQYAARHVGPAGPVRQP